MSKMLQDGQEILEGRFQIIKKLGSGAFGEIYKGKCGVRTIEENETVSGMRNYGLFGSLDSCQI